MRKFTMTLTLTLALLLCGMSQAAGEYADTRLNLSDRKPSYDVGCGNSAVDIWGFALPSFPIVEVGHLHQFKCGRAKILAGGYVSYWQVPGKFYLEPWAKSNVRLGGGWSFNSTAGAYAPLTKGGKWQVYADNLSLNYATTQNTTLGVFGTFWSTQGAKTKGSIGPCASITLGNYAKLSLRAGLGLGKSNSLRAELTVF